MKIVLHLLSTVLFFTATTVGAQNWQTDMSKAQKIASEKNALVLLVFQGSDWCAPCIKLNKEVWSTSAFKAHAANNFVMVQADFPRKKKNALSTGQVIKNQQLAEQYNAEGVFPFVVVLNAFGKVIGQTGYKKLKPKEYIQHIESFKE